MFVSENTANDARMFESLSLQMPIMKVFQFPSLAITFVCRNMINWKKELTGETKNKAMQLFIRNCQ